MSVPSSRLPGVVTTATATADVPDRCSSGFVTSDAVKCPVYAARQMACFGVRSSWASWP